jgi:hypothetical protein
VYRSNVAENDDLRRSGTFDRFAAHASDFVSEAVFFLACVLLVVVWLPSYFVFRDIDTWQLVINTATTIVTFDGLRGSRPRTPSSQSDMRDLRRAVGIEKPG